MNLNRALNYADKQRVKGPLALRDVLEVLAEFGIEHVPLIEGSGEGESVGLCDANKQIISVSMQQTRFDKYETLLHEMIHARDFIYGFRSTERYTERRTKATFREIFGRENRGRIL
jgi:hypothetical protein